MPFQVAARHTRKPGCGRFCSRPCSASYAASRGHVLNPQDGSANPNWKGGVSTDGYRYVKRFIAKFPEKKRAQVMVTKAIAKGELVRPDTCSACAATCRPHAHHDDYAQPLIVRWLCRDCHIQHHAAERRKERAA